MRDARAEGRSQHVPVEGAQGAHSARGAPGTFLLEGASTCVCLNREKKNWGLAETNPDRPGHYIYSRAVARQRQAERTRRDTALIFFGDQPMPLVPHGDNREQAESARRRTTAGGLMIALQ